MKLRFEIKYRIRTEFTLQKMIKQEFVRPIEMAVRLRPSARAEKYMCHCNSLGGVTWRSVTITGRTDRQTEDRQSATQYAAPS